MLIVETLSVSEYRSVWLRHADPLPTHQSVVKIVTPSILFVLCLYKTAKNQWPSSSHCSIHRNGNTNYKEKPLCIKEPTRKKYQLALNHCCFRLYPCVYFYIILHWTLISNGIFVRYEKLLLPNASRKQL